MNAPGWHGAGPETIRSQEGDGLLAPGEVAGEGGGKGGVERPRADRTPLDAGAAADAARRIGAGLVAARNGSDGADRRTTPAVGAAGRIAFGQIDHRILLLLASVAQDKADEAQRRETWRTAVFQLRGVDRRGVAGVELPSDGLSEDGSGGEVLRIGTSGGDRCLRCGVGVFADEGSGGYRYESLPAGPRGQLRDGMLEGPVAVHGHDDRRTARPADVPEPLGGRRGDVPAIDGYGDDGDAPLRNRRLRSGGMRQIERLCGECLCGPAVRRGYSPGDGLGDFFRGSGR